jgi:hypothetical protein
VPQYDRAPRASGWSGGSNMTVQLSTISLLGVMLAMCGCSSSEPPSSVGVRSTVTESPDPFRVELYEPRVWRESPDLVQFEVQYRIASGRPWYSYHLEIRFPGTDNAGTKSLLGWEFQPEGTLRDAIFVDEADLHEFEMELIEVQFTPDFTRESVTFPVSNRIDGTVGTRVPGDAGEAQEPAATPSVTERPRSKLADGSLTETTHEHE